MRTGLSDAQIRLGMSWVPMVSSWLGSRVLANSLPVISGQVTWTVDQQVTSSVDLVIAGESIENGYTRKWLPSDPGDALARYGQQLAVSVLARGVLFRLGRFQIMDWEEQDDGSIAVKAEGLLQAVADDRLTKATGPRDGGTLRSEFRRLTPSYMSVQFDDTALSDRACPKAMEWDEGRLDALYNIADAWPARIREDASGNIRVLRPLADMPNPTVTFTDGDFGTVVAGRVRDTREGTANVFVARSSADGVNAQAIVRIEDGPAAASGDYKPVPTFLASPVLLTNAQCRAAATTMRTNSLRKSKVRRVEVVPDPRPELDDAVRVVTGAGTRERLEEWGYVVGVVMPLTIYDGPTVLDVAV